MDGVGKSGSCCFWVVSTVVLVHPISVACDVGPRTRPENSVKMARWVDDFPTQILHFDPRSWIASIAMEYG